MDHQDERSWSWDFDRDDEPRDEPVRDDRDDADFEEFLAAYQEAVEAGSVPIPPFLADLIGDGLDDADAPDDGEPGDDDGEPGDADDGIPQFVVDSFLDRDGDGEVDAGDFVGFVPPFLQGDGDDAGDGDDGDDEAPGFGFGPFAGGGFGGFVPPFLQDDDGDDADGDGDDEAPAFGNPFAGGGFVPPFLQGDDGDGDDGDDDAPAFGAPFGGFDFAGFGPFAGDDDADDGGVDDDADAFDFVFRNFLDGDGDGEFDADDLAALIVPPFLSPGDAEDAGDDVGGMDDADAFQFADAQDIA